MLRLQFYVLRRLAASLFLIVAVVGTVLFVGQTVMLLHRVPDVGLGFVLTILPLFLPMTLALTIPFAFLVAAISVYGRLADDNEVIAMRMAGIHPWAVAAPGVFAGAVLSFFCLDLQGHLVPDAIAGQDDLKGDVYRRFLEIVERSEKDSYTGRDFKISWAGVEDGALVGLHISRGGPGSPDMQEIHAGRGVLEKDPTGQVLVFALKDYTWLQGREGRRDTSRGSGLTFAIPAADLLGEQGSVARPRALSYEGLLFRLRRLGVDSESRNEVQRELLGRIAIALAPLCFALSGIPLALLVGKGSRAAAAVLAFGLALAFYVLLQAGNSLAAGNKVPMVPAMFAGNAVLAAVGAVLLRAVVRR